MPEGFSVNKRYFGGSQDDLDDTSHTIFESQDYDFATDRIRKRQRKRRNWCDDDGNRKLRRPARNKRQDFD